MLPFNDPIINAVAQQCSIPELKVTSNLFLDLVEDIISQQLSGRVAQAIFSRFCSLFPNQLPTPDRLMLCSIEELRSVGLSNAKSNYVRNIAEYALRSNLTVENFGLLTDEQVVKELTTIKGVGVWTAQMVLIFSLNRPDIFPIDDLAVRQGMQKLYSIDFDGVKLKEKLTAIANSWKPYRTVGTRYIWAWTNNQKNNAVRF